MLTNIHRINEINCGDMSSSPFNYFNFGSKFSQKICISHLPKHSRTKFTILGGGGLFYDEWHHDLNKYFLEKNAPIVIWGAGLNYHQTKENATFPNFIKYADLIGVRDYNKGFRWVPCPSCMSKKFDESFCIKNKIVVFEHVENSILTDLPKFTNNKTMNEAIEFLGQSECVITNSYHGVYWATLLNKKVIAIPVFGSSRFYNFKHTPYISENFTTNFNKARVYEKSLIECRQSNTKFYEDVLCFIKKVRIF